MLEKIMQELFLNYFNNFNDNQQSTAIKTSNVSDSKQQLRHVLKSYSLLSKQRQAEQLFTDHRVKSYMEEVFTS